jgi:hypothetical protein
MSHLKFGDRVKVVGPQLTGTKGTITGLNAFYDFSVTLDDGHQFGCFETELVRLVRKRNRSKPPKVFTYYENLLGSTNSLIEGDHRDSLSASPAIGTIKLLQLLEDVK